jgi:O-6-methylguanine DNA methyltransferase
MRIDDSGIIESRVFRTDFGWAGVAVSEQGICAIVLPKKDKKAVEQELSSSESGVPPIETFEGRLRSERDTFGPAAVLGKAVKFLQRYFAGERVSFDLPVDMRYYTAFQQAVWKAAAEIPPGETRSYGWIAKRIRNPRAVRAVGQALGANPVPIIIPCHRVISSAGTLGGYSGGIGIKKRLLELEKNKDINHGAHRGKRT